MRTWIAAAAAFVAGAGVVGGSWLALSGKSSPGVRPEPRATGEGEDCSALRRANENLMDSLHTCDRKLADLRDPSPTAATTADTPPDRERDRDRDGGRWGRRRGEPTKEDWERMAQMGAVRVRIPCVRDKPWSPPPRIADRLGLAPHDGDTIREAYERSNKRIASEIQPLCVKALGSAEAAEKLSPSVCIDAIAAAARKSNPQAMREAMSRVAEVQAGSRGAPKPGEAPAVEQLALLLVNESKAFESDLAQKLGPEEAKRLANAPEMCADRRMLRASDDREER
jgi:hypothetical protein